MTDAPSEPEEPQLKPSAMRGTEPLYGIVVVIELVGVAILNLVITHGKGAPAHPDTAVSAAGVAVSVAVGALMLTRNRMIVGFAAIAAAFVVSLPKVPNELAFYHFFALIIPIIYALVLTQRQRKLTMARIKAERAQGGPSAGQSRQPRQPRQPRQRRERKVKVEPSGPKPSRRYTPPKAKRSPRAK